MALTEKLIAIADAIRKKTGETDFLTLDEMPIKISEITVTERIETLLKPGDYPSYITPEVLEVVSKVRSAQKDDSITFIAMSDSHYPAEQRDLNFYEDETVASTIQANQAAKVLTYLLKPDFFAHLGDVSTGAGTTTPEILKTQIEEFINYFREASGNLPVFLCIGNHDAGIYYHDSQTDGEIHTLSGSYLYNNFTAHSISDNTVVGGEENGGYCYRDFMDKKLRVIMLNTSEKLVARQKDVTTFGSQRLWLANVLLDLNNKTDAADWGFIVLSHYPADYGATMPLSYVLEAYVKGTSVTITDPENSDYYRGDGTNQSVNFSGKNKAKFVAQFHGHIHNFLTSRLYSNASGSPIQYDAWRICTPNGQFNRENYYGVFGDIDFADTQTYPKTRNTANGTSFVVNVINPSEEKIYSFCYGAGPEKPREIFYNFNKIKYSIITKGTNINFTNLSDSIYEGDRYETELYAEEGYSLTHAQVMVTMNGEVISNAYSYDATTQKGVITIEKVIGEISINATTNVAAYYTINRNIDTQYATSTSDSKKIYPDNEGHFEHSETITLKDCLYYFDTLSVKMGGVDITSSKNNDGSSYVTEVEASGDTPGYCIINIKNVTGKIEITAIGYINFDKVNQLPLAIDTDGTLYNGGKGYLENHRMSTSSGAIQEVQGMYLSGLIAIDFTSQSLILHNVGTKTVSYNVSTVIGVNSDKTTVNGRVLLADLTPSDDNSITITSSNWGTTDLSKVKYVRISCSYLGEDSVVNVVNNT